jgi:tetratricopeptide (TPR) repeat protein
MNITKSFKCFIFFLTFLLSFCLFCNSSYSAVKNSAMEETYYAYAHFLTAELERFKGNSEKVIQEYENAIEYDPSSFYLRKKLIVFLLSQNKIDSAKSLMEQTVKLFPEESDLALVLSQLYESEGKKKTAIRTLDRIIKKDPENQGAYFLLFTLFLDDKQWKKAERYANRLVELTEKEKTENPEEIYAQIGLEYARVGHFSKGLEYLEKACILSPDDLRIHLALGTLYESKGKFEKALEEYEKALSLSPFSPVIYYRLGEVYSQLGRIDEAISIYEKVLQINNNDYVSITNLARLYYRKGEYQKGLKILQDSPLKDTHIYYLLGAFLIQLKRMDEAEINLKKSIELAPNFYVPYSLLIHIYGEQEKKDEALSLLNNASEKSLLPKEKLYFLFGVAYSQFKDYEKSISYLRKAHELNPYNDAIVFQLGASYERNRDWFRAVYNLRKAIKINPENAQALNYLGYMFAEKGIRLNEATSLIERALAIEPENGYFVDSLGWVYYQRGLLDEALKELERAIELLQREDEDDPIIREHLGDVYYKKGNLTEAQKQWEVSFSLDSTREEVKEKLEELKEK